MMVRQIRCVEAATRDFSPQILKCSIFSQGMDLPEGYKLEQRYVYDYELEFFLEGSGSIIVDHVEYPVRQGDIMFRKPGQLAQGIMPYNCYLICFDLLGNTGKEAEAYDLTREQDCQFRYKNSLLDQIPVIFHPNFSEKYHHLFDVILRNFIRAEEDAHLITKSSLLQILYHIYQDIKENTTNINMVSSAHASGIKRAIEFISKNYSRDMNLRQLSQVCNLSPTYFHKIFAQAMGVTPNEYVTKIRLDKAKELLIETSLPVSEVAVYCGFNNIPYFSYLFKKRLGIAPGEYKRRNSYM